MSTWHQFQIIICGNNIIRGPYCPMSLWAPKMLPLYVWYEGGGCWLLGHLNDTSFPVDQYFLTTHPTTSFIPHPHNIMYAHVYYIYFYTPPPKTIMSIPLYHPIQVTFVILTPYYSLSRSWWVLIVALRTIPLILRFS